LLPNAHRWMDTLIVPTNVCSPYSCISLNPDLLFCNVD
jgi:hypothetical protein